MNAELDAGPVQLGAVPVRCWARIWGGGSLTPIVGTGMKMRLEKRDNKNMGCKNNILERRTQDRNESWR